MPDINRFDKVQTMIRLALEIAARRQGVTTKEARALMEELGEQASSDRTAQRAMNGLAAAFPGFYKDETSGRWKWPGRDIPAALLSADAEVWPDLKQAAQMMYDRGDIAASLRIQKLSNQVAAMNMSEKHTRERRDIVIRAMETEALLYRPGPEPLFEAEILEVVRHALRERRKLAFTYEKQDGSTSKRLVMPYGVLLAQIAYLVACQDGKDTPVLWRLDRIIEPYLSEQSCTVPEDFNLNAYASRSFGVFQGEEDVAVTLRVLPDAAADAEYHRFHTSQTHEWQEDGSLIVRLYGRSLGELALQLLPWGGKLVVEGPQALRDLVREAGQRAVGMGEA